MNALKIIIIINEYPFEYFYLIEDNIFQCVAHLLGYARNGKQYPVALRTALIAQKYLMGSVPDVHNEC
jgi:hypothetical protein